MVLQLVPPTVSFKRWSELRLARTVIGYVIV